MLVETLESMKAADLVYNFIQKSDLMLYKYWPEAIQKEFGLPEEDVSLQLSQNDDFFGFSDGIVAEAFFLFVYCISVCGIFGMLTNSLKIFFVKVASLINYWPMSACLSLK